MCGIAGFYSCEDSIKEKQLYSLLNMKQTLTHRGPDDDNIYLNDHIGLAHTRLSIIDISKGKQPMVKRIGDYSIVISYNGEIYNTKELRSQLSSYSLSWDTTSDTEVILNGYLAFGTEFFKELNGIFAFSIYDERIDTLYLVRDHLGIKPLFYQIYDSYFVFASEPKGIFAFGITPKLDASSWAEVLGLGPARTPGHGVFANMKEVLPGQFLSITKDTSSTPKIRSHIYWKLESHEHKDNYKETVDYVSYLVRDSIRRQMISDVPVCTFLSGGLDSSLVSAISQEYLLEQGKQLSTFSFDFVGNKENFKANSFQSSEDRPFVDIMVEHIHSYHHYLMCDSITQADYLYKAVDARDVPCMADIESSLLYFCSQVSNTHSVALTGECADEIFGGYPWFHRKELWKDDFFPWSYDMDMRKMCFDDSFLKEIDLDNYVINAYHNSLKETPTLAGDTPLEKKRREISWLNIRWFMATLLNRMDRTSMYSGLEARVPFADPRILEYVFSIPWEMKCYNGQTKSLLVEIGKSYLPNEVLYRKKSPYPKTYDPNYERLLSNRLLDELSDTNAPLNAIIDKKKLQIFLSSPSDYGRPWYGQLMASPQMIAYLLQINYWMKKYSLS